MELKGKRAILFLDDLYNDFEFWIPYYRLLEAGAEVLVAGPKKGSFHSKAGLGAEATHAFTDIDPATTHGLVIPGGYAPDRIRLHEAALDIVRALDKAGKAVAFICHAGWVPISAGILGGRKATSYAAIKDDMINAGANWVDEPLVVDNNLVSSRTPADLPVFMPAVVAALARS